MESWERRRSQGATIRYYEQIGLLPEAERSAGN
ncbi:Bacterial regulatory protein, MerR domain protein, partial [marine sediment metagenome]